MSLDNFDRHIYAQKGENSADEFMLKNYGVDVSRKTAEGHRAGIHHHLEKKQNEGGVPDFEKETYDFAEDGSLTKEKVIMLAEGEKQNPKTIMEKMGLDPVMWDLKSHTLDYKGYQVTLKLSQGSDEHGNKAPEIDKTVTNYAFGAKVRVEPRQDLITSDGIKGIFADLTPPKLEKYDNKYDTGFCLALATLDNHFGKAGLTLKEQSELYRESVLDIISQLNYKLDSVIIQVGQDHFDIDGAGYSTAAGTRMEVNDNWSNIYKVGVREYFWTIEQFRPLTERVIVYYVPGNHDPTLGLAAAYHLEKVYEPHDDVIVESVDYPRKYHKHGLVMLGMSHGKEEGKSRIKNIMQYEAGEMWGKTIWREFLLGDLHHEEAREEGGIVHRRSSSVTHIDDWHEKKGYTMATRKAQAHLYHEERGKRGTVESVIRKKIKVKSGETNPGG